MHDEIIDGLYDACSSLQLIAHAADSIASGTTDDPAKLAGSVRQVVWALSEMLGKHIDLLEIAQRQGPSVTAGEAIN